MKSHGHVSEAREVTTRAFQEYGTQADSVDREGVVKRSTELVLLGLFVVAFWLVASKVPASGDDWTWGSSIGMNRLTRGFSDYNGRYVGNLVVVAMTRLGWISPIIQSLGFAAIIGLCLDITRNRTVSGYATLAALVFLMPAPLWSESAVWIPGFANYAAASIAILIFLRFGFRELAVNRNDQTGWLTLGGIFVFAAASQLLAEHVTVYLLLASVGALAAARIIQGCVNRRLLSWTAGFGFGAVLMFSNAHYRTIVSGSGDSYRAVGSQGGSLLSQSKLALRDQIATNGLISNRAVILAIASLVALTAAVKLVRSYRTSGVSWLLLAAALTAAIVALVAGSKMALDPLESGSMKIVLAMGAAVILLLLATFLLTEPSDRMIVVVSVASMVVLSAPLLLVRPISARTFLPSYIILLIVVSVFLSNLNAIGSARLLLVWTILVLAAGLVGWNHSYRIYSEIGKASDERVALIREQVERGASEVVMERLPHDAWMQRPEPFGAWWMKAFKLYYDLPPDLSISITD
ncbi:MAG: DUF6056 family protein [Candidatus Nanopelagicales bacterium]|jgi:hypothetical protein